MNILSTLMLYSLSLINLLNLNTIQINPMGENLDIMSTNSISNHGYIIGAVINDFERYTYEKPEDYYNNTENYEYTDKTSENYIYEFDGWESGISPMSGYIRAYKDDKYGLVNLDLEVVLPFEYDWIIGYGFDAFSSEWITDEDEFNIYAFHSERPIEINFKDGVMKEFELYNKNNAEKYDVIIDIRDYTPIIVDDFLTLNLNPAKTTNELFYAVLPIIDFDFFAGDKKVDFKIEKIIQPTPLYYPSIRGWQSEGIGEPKIGTLGIENILPRPVSIQTNYAEYSHIAEQYLSDISAEESPYTIQEVFTGDFLNNGSTSAVIHFNTDSEYMNYLYENQLEIDLSEIKKQKFFSVILLIPDTRKLEYKIVAESILEPEEIEGHRSGYMLSRYYSVYQIGQFVGDDKYEIAVKSQGIDAWDREYHIINLENL